MNESAGIKSSSNNKFAGLPKIFKWILLGFFQTILYVSTLPASIILFVYRLIILISVEVYRVVKWSYQGILATIKFIFVTCIYGLINFAFDKIFVMYKNTNSAFKNWDETKKRLNEKLMDKYNNLGFVKKRRIQLENEKDQLLKELNDAAAVKSMTPRVYKYIAKNKSGKMISGIFDGFSKQDCNVFLINEGLEVYSIKTSKLYDFIYGQSSIIPQKVNNKDLVFWLTQLATYVKAGIPLTDGIKLLAKQMANTKNKRIFNSLIFELMMGQSFSTALEKQGSVFPNLLINMVRAAEATGDLEQTLEDMAKYYKEVDATRKQMISAMTYPSLILVFSLGVVTFILLYVIPSFQDVYAQAGFEVNGLTATVINISLFLQSNISYILIAIFAIIMGLIFMYKKIKAFRVSIQSLAMKIPVLKNVIIYNELTIFTKTFASLLRNNVYINDSINILSKITNNEIYRAIMFKTISNIAKGEKISEAFKDHWAVPDVAYYMIVTGESTGELAEMMQTVSDYYQENHKTVVTNLKTFIEPVMIVFLAVIVGTIIVSVIVPMFEMYNQIQL